MSHLSLARQMSSLEEHKHRRWRGGNTSGGRRRGGGGAYLVMRSAVSWWDGWPSSWTFWPCCQTQKLWRVVAALKLTVGPSCLHTSGALEYEKTAAAALGLLTLTVGSFSLFLV